MLQKLHRKLSVLISIDIDTTWHVVKNYQGYFLLLTLEGIWWTEKIMELVLISSPHIFI